MQTPVGSPSQVLRSAVLDKGSRGWRPSALMKPAGEAFSAVAGEAGRYAGALVLVPSSAGKGSGGVSR